VGPMGDGTGQEDGAIYWRSTRAVLRAARCEIDVPDSVLLGAAAPIAVARRRFLEEKEASRNIPFSPFFLSC
jgi:hypothetical protein